MKINKKVKCIEELKKSDITDYSNTIDWSEVSQVVLMVYQFDENDTEFDDEGECIEYFEIEDPSEFKNVQKEAVNYADKIAKRDSTPMSIVLMGYDFDGESMDEYWDTIYYVTPIKEKFQNSDAQKLKIKEYMSNPEEDTHKILYVQLKNLHQNILTLRRLYSKYQKEFEQNITNEDALWQLYDKMNKINIDIPEELLK